MKRLLCLFGLTAFLISGIFSAPAGAETARSYAEFQSQQHHALSIMRTIDPLGRPVDDAAPYVRVPVQIRGLDATGSLAWEASDPMGMMNNLGLSDDGSVAAIDIDLNNQRLQVLDGESGSVSYEIVSERSGWESVAVAGNGNHIAYATGSLLYLLSPATSTPIWTATSGSCIRVAISADGQHILGLEGPLTGTPDSVHVWSYSAASSTPEWVREFPSTEAGYFNGAKYSADGSTLVITGRNHVWIVNPVTGAPIDDFAAFNTEKPAAVSGNGHVITYGSLNSGKLYVYVWNSATQDYTLFWTYTFTGGTSNWCTATGVSEDGETIGAGTLQFTASGYDAFFAVFDTYGNGRPLWTPARMGDYVTEVALSRDGLTVAATSWGPTDASTANIKVFDKYDSTPFFTYSHPGSANAAALMPDGSRLFVGGKAVHNRQMGWGGNAFMFALDLEGGTIAGSATVQGTTDYSGVTIELDNGTRFATTALTGTYSLMHVPAGTYSVIAHKQGYSTETVGNIQVTEGGTISGVNFALDSVGAAPTGLAASQTSENRIRLTWNPVTARAQQMRDEDRRITTGEAPYIDPRGPIDLRSAESLEQARTGHGFSRFGLDELDEADSIHVWRSVLPGGPYRLVGSLDGDATAFSDTIIGLHPGTNYFYVVSAVYPNGDSRYSNEAMGALVDDYINFAPTVPAGTIPVTFDGVISPAEWTDAVRVDVSDVYGYDAQNVPGTAFVYMKYDDALDLLLVAAEDHINTQLDTLEGIGFYVDDDHSGSWTVSRPGSEGNYWAYWGPHGGSLRYRSLSGGDYGSAYYYFPNPQMGFSVAAGYMTMEVAIPMGFHHVYDLALYGPNRIAGVGVFVGRRENNVTVFDGWWPQDVPSMPSNPDFFSATTIPAQLYVPPSAPTAVQVTNQPNGLQVTWVDPATGIDNLPLNGLNAIYIYRNGEAMDAVDPGVGSWVDNTPVYGGWYEYTLSGIILDHDVPFEGPLSQPVGGYFGTTPEIEVIGHDDGVAELYTIPSSTYDGNREAVQLEMPEGSSKVYTIEFMTNTTAQIGIGIAANNNSRPGLQRCGPFWIHAPVAQEMVTFHIPGIQAPTITQDSFWVTVDWPSASPNDPGIGTDWSQPYHEVSWQYTRTTGWVQATTLNFMLRAGVGAPVSAVDPENPAVAHQFRLMANYPNPFNPQTMIPFELSHSGDASITVYNLMGQKVTTLLSGPITAGYHVVSWDARDAAGLEVATGIYLVRLESEGLSATQKITLLR